MIDELSPEHCWSLRQHDHCPVLIAYLNQTTYSRQLKALIELSEVFRDELKIYVTRDTRLKVAGDSADITGTPTYILVQDGAERDRMLGESDAERLKNFVGIRFDLSGHGTYKQRQGTARGVTCG